MKMFKLFTIIILISQLQGVFATSSKISVYDDVTDLNVIKTDFLTNEKDKESTLVIFDIDDTLLEAVNFVGSDKWYAWQRGKEVYGHNGELIKVKEEQVYACMFSILGTLFDLGTSKLTQPDSAKIVTDLKDYNLMLLTARTYSFRRATERELNINGIDFSNNHLVEANKTLDFSLNDGKRTDRVTYFRGLVMSSGLDKGKVLRQVLSRIGKSYKSIYFVDDSRRNINNMVNEWKNDDSRFSIYHYTKVDKTVSVEEIAESDQAKKLFDGFLKSAYFDRSLTFDNGTCR
jgi:FMN phosphatase YigB (HAD superfamily)